MIDVHSITSRIKSISITETDIENGRVADLFKKAGEILEEEKGSLTTVEFIIDPAGMHLILHMDISGE